MIPLNPVNYATQMDLYYAELRDTIANATEDVDTSALREAIDTFREQAQEAEELKQQALDAGNSALIDVMNAKFRDFQRGFTSQGGLPGREFFQHLIFAPGLDTGYAPVTFPGITEAVEAGDFEVAREFVVKTAAAVRVAGEILKT
jgi:N-acetylated-alpha-linked acidic dipeptidase